MARSVEHPWQEALQKHRPQLIALADEHDVFLSRLIDYLIAARCLQRDQKELVFKQQLSRTRMATLLDLVESENEPAFEVLCEALKSFGTSAKDDVADSLQRSLKQAKWRTDPVKLILSTKEGKPIYGVTSLNNELYTAQGDKDKQKDIIDVFDVEKMIFRRHLHEVPSFGSINDMTSCDRHQCIYFADSSNKVVHRITVENKKTQWPVRDVPCSLSVNSASNVLVTCRRVGRIKEFTTDGQLLREVRLQSNIVNPWHAIEQTADQFIVCHGDVGDPQHRVCIVNSSGRVLRSVGGSPGSGRKRFNVPERLAAVNGMILVADYNNDRVVQLSSSLTFIREVLSDLMNPMRMWFDKRTCRLYAADNTFEDDELVTSQLKVYSV